VTFTYLILLCSDTILSIFEGKGKYKKREERREELKNRQKTEVWKYSKMAEQDLAFWLHPWISVHHRFCADSHPLNEHVEAQIKK
jgi:hypothetical protein